MLGHASKWLRTLRMKFPSRYFTVSFDYRSKIEAVLCLLWLEKLQNFTVHTKGTQRVFLYIYSAISPSITAIILVLA